MEITTRTVGKCKVLDCSGPITTGLATATLRQALREAVQDGYSKVVMNFRKMPYVDALGLGELVNSYVYLRKRGGKLVLLNLSKIMHRHLSIVKLLPLIEVYDDEAKALEGCEQPDTQPIKEEQ